MAEQTNFRELTLNATPDHAHADPRTLHQVLPTYYEVPHGCGVHTVPDDRMEPLMSRGDLVVVDLTDRHSCPTSSTCS